MDRWTADQGATDGQSCVYYMMEYSPNLPNSEEIGSLAATITHLKDMLRKNTGRGHFGVLPELLSNQPVHKDPADQKLLYVVVCY